MPNLIRKIEGEILTYTVGDVILIKSIVGQVQREDYISINGFVAYLQNLTQTGITQRGLSPLEFGLPNVNNIPEITIEIDYSK